MLKVKKLFCSASYKIERQHKDLFQTSYLHNHITLKALFRTM